MRLSTRIGLAVGCTVPLLVLASGWLLTQLVARDLNRAGDQHLRRPPRRPGRPHAGRPRPGVRGAD
ncbi:two-component sensor histidine kinase, partial [Streptomyces seoulensis]